MLPPHIARFFRDELKAARAQALRDAEAFPAVIVVLESLGRYLDRSVKILGNAHDVLSAIASASPLAEGHAGWPYAPSFSKLFHMVRSARNSAVHEGALARHLTVHAVSLSIVLEHALMPHDPLAADLMVPNPLCALPWQPLSLLRQSLLSNSFSVLPVFLDSGAGPCWHLVSEQALARFLRESPENSKARLRQSLQDAVSEGLVLLVAPIYPPTAPVSDLLRTAGPALVVAPNSQTLLGIITPFDLL